MNPKTLKNLLQDLAQGNTDPETVFEKLKTLPYEDLGFARIDHHRSLRNTGPETVYCAGKSPTQIIKIIQKIRKSGNDVLATRLESDIYAIIKRRLPAKTFYSPEGRILVIKSGKPKKSFGRILVITAGTSDIPVAEEAALTADLLGSSVGRIFDVGVAGIHRLFDELDQLRQAHVLIVVAGMDGALPSVVGGLVEKPVIAVPTSVGYGASFNGLAALLSMLNSCSAGIATVNIDNGFGAGVLAHKINSLTLTSGNG